MEKVEEVKEKVKESLVGVEVEPEDHKSQPSSSQTNAAFNQHAVLDEESGEYYLGQKEFVDAVAPEGEDYVSTWFSFHTYTCTRTMFGGRRQAWHVRVHLPTMHSTRSSANNTPSSSRSPTGNTKIE